MERWVFIFQQLRAILLPSATGPPASQDAPPPPGPGVQRTQPDAIKQQNAARTALPGPGGRRGGQGYRRGQRGCDHKSAARRSRQARRHPHRLEGQGPSFQPPALQQTEAGNPRGAPKAAANRPMERTFRPQRSRDEATRRRPVRRPTSHQPIREVLEHGRDGTGPGATFRRRASTQEARRNPEQQEEAPAPPTTTKTASRLTIPRRSTFQPLAEEIEKTRRPSDDQRQETHEDERIQGAQRRRSEPSSNRATSRSRGAPGPGGDRLDRYHLGSEQRHPADGEGVRAVGLGRQDQAHQRRWRGGCLCRQRGPAPGGAGPQPQWRHEGPRRRPGRRDRAAGRERMQP